MPFYRQDIEEYFVELLLRSPDLSVPNAIFETASNFPMTFASEASFAFASAASAFEDPVVETPQHLTGISAEIYKAAALFSADTYAAEALFDRRVTCRDIADIWIRSRDTYFTPNNATVSTA